MRILGCLSVILGLTSGAALAEPHRQHAPHEHGHGTLNLAIDGKKMVLQLTAPSQDIVGFEHAATTPSQQEAVHHARTALSSPADLFTLSAAAECAFQHQSIRIGNNPAPMSDEEGKHGEHHEEHGEIIFHKSLCLAALAQFEQGVVLADFATDLSHRANRGNGEFFRIRKTLEIGEPDLAQRVRLLTCQLIFSVNF